MPLPLPPSVEGGWAWFLDFDGTLVELGPTPAQITLSPQVVTLLERLRYRHEGALAVITGRTLESVQRHLGTFRPAASGSHGMELRDPQGRESRLTPPAELEDVRQRFHDLTRTYAGLVLEDKKVSLALHYRQVPQHEEALGRAARAIVARHPIFTLMQGKMVFEIKPLGISKGSAVRTLMAEAPFAGRVPVFVGDDTSDEDGFAAVNALGGVSVLVGDERATAARYRVKDVAACLSWLASGEDRS